MDDTTTPVAPAYTPATEDKKAFLKALSAAQGEFLAIKRERTVNIKPRDSVAYTFKYAELAVIIDACRPALAKNGLSLRSKITPGQEAGTVWLTSILGHAEGYEDVSEMLVVIAGDLKQFGGQLTYLRRYIQGPQLGVASEDDMDENGKQAGEGGADNGVGGQGTRAPAPAPAPRAPQRASAAAPRPVNVDKPAAQPEPKPEVKPAGEKMATAAQIKWLAEQIEGMDGEVADRLLTNAGVLDMNSPTAAAWEAARTALRAAA